MAPTYKNGTMVMTQPVNRPLVHGDIVVLHNELGTLIKRVALVPGDKIQKFHTGVGWVAIFSPLTPKELLRHNFITEIVPPGMIYVLGDNRGRSVDSRTFGFVSIENVDRIVMSPRPFRGNPGMLVGRT